MNTIIEKIRAKVERRKKQMVDASYPPVIKKTRISELSIVLDILDDIQERTDNPITFPLQEQPVKVGDKVSIIKKKEGIVTRISDGKARVETGDTMEIVNLSDLVTEQPVCEGLEEEINRTYHDGSVTDTSDLDHNSYENIARHFYELGRQSKQEVSEELMEEIDKRWKEWISKDEDHAEGILTKNEFAYFAVHFAIWQRHKMFMDGLKAVKSNQSSLIEKTIAGVFVKYGMDVQKQKMLQSEVEGKAHPQDTD